MFDERSADVRVVTDAVAMDDEIYQRKRAQEKEQQDSRVATRTIHRGRRLGDSLEREPASPLFPEILPSLKGEISYGLTVQA